MVKGISVIIPNYNGINLLPITLPTVILALENSSRPYEIILADDCSTDASVEYVHQNFPQIRIAENTINSGFSVTANRGIALSVYDKFLLLNSDVKLMPDYFGHQYKYFDDPVTFGVMGRIVGWQDDIIQDGAKYSYFHGAKIKTAGNYILKDPGLMENGLYTTYLSGANAFIDKEKFLLIGGFNEMFSPFYSEDYELSLRAWRLGFTCWFDYESVCRHKVSHTIKSENKKRAVKAVYDRNKMFVHALHLEGIYRTIWFIQVTAGCIARLLLFKFYFVKAYFMFLASFNEIRRCRKEFLVLSAKTKCNRTIYDVHDFISSGIKNKEVIYF